jgi:hypothetical protein
VPHSYHGRHWRCFEAEDVYAGFPKLLNAEEIESFVLTAAKDASEKLKAEANGLPFFALGTGLNAPDRLSKRNCNTRSRC